MKKNVLSGLLAGFVMLLIWFGFSYVLMWVFPDLVSQYDNTNLYRSMKDPISGLFVFHPFVLALILAFVWDKSKTLFSARKFFTRGVQFGLVYFVIVLPGILMSYITSPYSAEIVLSWVVSVLISALTAGIVFEKINA